MSTAARLSGDRGDTPALQSAAMFVPHHRWRLVSWALISIALLVAETAGAGSRPNIAGAGRPNIVVIMSDDAGYSDPGCYGGEIPTPNIDALARQGVRFAKFYTNARCSPTRASLLTGMYPHRVGAAALCDPQYETPYPGYKRSMSKQAVTVAEAMRGAGYHTLMSGKWHLGGQQAADADRRPRARGFDRFFGQVDGGAHYFKPERYQLDDAPYAGAAEEYGTSFYGTRAISDYAVRFLREARAQDSRPIFLYVAYAAPHKPRQAPAAEIAKQRHLYQGGIWEDVRQARYQRLRAEGLIDDSWRYQELTPEQQKNFNRKGWALAEMTQVAALTSIMDEGVGQIVDALRQMGELEQTLIVYLSDNGPAGFHAFVGATPLTGEKRFLTEGGTATHCILHWPGGIRRPGRIERRPGHVIDLMPTFLELAGATKSSAIDGQSLMPVIKGKRWRGHKMLFWELYSQQVVIKSSRWKYLTEPDGTAHLYDLRADPAETVDLAAVRPGRLRKLADRYQRWASANNVMPPGVVEAWLVEQGEKKKNKKKRKGTS